MMRVEQNMHSHLSRHWHCIGTDVGHPQDRTWKATRRNLPLELRECPNATPRLCLLCGPAVEEAGPVSRVGWKQRTSETWLWRDMFSRGWSLLPAPPPRCLLLLSPSPWPFPSSLFPQLWLHALSCSPPVASPRRWRANPSLPLQHGLLLLVPLATPPPCCSLCILLAFLHYLLVLSPFRALKMHGEETFNNTFL